MTGRRKTHGHASPPSPTYITWQSMKDRVLNTRHIRHAEYGGLGIEIQDSWHNFAGFLADMGVRPDGATLDRVDSDGDYSVENCRWATHQQQANNRSNTVRFTHQGVTKSLEEWATITGIYPETLRKRWLAGWSDSRLLTEPVHTKHRRKQPQEKQHAPRHTPA